MKDLLQILHLQLAFHSPAGNGVVAKLRADRLSMMCQQCFDLVKYLPCIFPMIPANW